MIPSSVRIFVCNEPQDMRRSFDGLALAARQHVGEDPESGALFVFVNKKRNRARCCGSIATVTAFCTSVCTTRASSCRTNARSTRNRWGC